MLLQEPQGKNAELEKNISQFGEQLGGKNKLSQSCGMLRMMQDMSSRVKSLCKADVWVDIVQYKRM